MYTSTSLTTRSLLVLEGGGCNTCHSCLVRNRTPEPIRIRRPLDLDIPLQVTRALKGDLGDPVERRAALVAAQGVGHLHAQALLVAENAKTYTPPHSHPNPRPFIDPPWSRISVSEATPRSSKADPILPHPHPRTHPRLYNGPKFSRDRRKKSHKMFLKKKIEFPL